MSCKEDLQKAKEDAEALQLAVIELTNQLVMTAMEKQSRIEKLESEKQILSVSKTQSTEAWLASVAKLELVREIVQLARAAGTIPNLVLAQLDQVLAPDLDALERLRQRMLDSRTISAESVANTLRLELESSKARVRELEDMLAITANSRDSNHRHRLDADAKVCSFRDIIEGAIYLIDNNQSLRARAKLQGAL